MKLRFYLYTWLVLTQAITHSGVHARLLLCSSVSRKQGCLCVKARYLNSGCRTHYSFIRSHGFPTCLASLLFQLT